MTMDPMWIWIALAAVAVLIVIGLIARGVRRSRTDELREHFGSEYERTVRAKGRTRAEQDLIGRADEVKTFEIHPLSAADRDRFAAEWAKVEARFVERPTTAVVEADELISDVMRTEGYPMGDFEKHAAHLSVKHPRIIEHYRAGHGVIATDRDRPASTEDMRQAMLHYRALFEELAGRNVDVVRDLPVERELPAAPERERLIESDEIRDEDRPR